MSWQKRFLAIWITASALLTVTAVGKRREPITPGMAAATVLIGAGPVLAVISA